MKQFYFIISVCFLSSISVVMASARSVDESGFETSIRERLQGFADNIAVVDSFLNARLKGKRVFIHHPETREALAARITDGLWREKDENKSLTDHEAFSTQTKYTDRMMPDFIDHVRSEHKPATAKYDRMIETHKTLKTLFGDIVSYTRVDFETTRDPGYRGGSKAHADMLHLAAHELWKQSVICRLKFSVYAHQLYKEEIPNFLAVETDGFSAYRSIFIPTVSTGRSHELEANLSFSLSRATHKPTVRFIFDTGATTTSLPWSFVEALGVQATDLTWNVECRTASGIVMAAKLRIHYLQLDPHVVFRDMEVSVVPGGRDALLGMDIISQLLDVRTRGDEKTLVAKENNWVDLH